MKTFSNAVQFILAFCFMLVFEKAYSQTNTFPTTGAAGIGTLSPNASALLDVTSTTQGVLVPRMTKNQRDGIAAPAQGLLIFQTNSTPGFYYYDGSAWSAVTPKGGANKTLGNLSAPTAVNVALLPAVDNSTNIGSSSLAWNDLYLSGKLYLDGAAFLSNGGTENTFVGMNSGNSITTGFDNTAIGFQSLYSNNTGYSNISIGHSSLYNSTSTSHNIAIGKQSLFINQLGSNNVAIGSFALYHSTADFNHAIGFEALYENTTGTSNIAIGYQSLSKNTTGNSNIAIGHKALFSSTSGSGSVAIGDSALYNNTIGYNNTANGYQALHENTSGARNTANGYHALYSNISGNNNTANGYQSLYSSTAGNNTANGYQALHENTTGDNNTANGYQALYFNTTGFNNTANGYRALYSNTTGSHNVAIGYSAGSGFVPGDKCTFLGYDAELTVAGLTNSTAIGNGALVSASNNMAFGNSSVIGWGFGVAPSTRAIKVGTGSTNGNGAYLTVGGVWTDVSDINKKENITELDKNAFLQKILQLKISQWKYKGTENEIHIGPMAADFHKLFEVGDDSSISSMDKTGVLFLGIQALSDEDGRLKTEDLRQSTELDSLQLAIGNLQKENTVMKAQLAALQSAIQNPNSAMTNGFAELKTINSKLSSAEALAKEGETLLGQNIPNPFDNSTLIPFRIPKNCHDASIMITNIALGEVVSVIPVSCNEDHLSIDAGTLSSGTYSYTLYVDGEMIGTKQMVIQK